jgi:hypothetical protein
LILSIFLQPKASIVWMSFYFSLKNTLQHIE